jgi:hypothetical protein
MGAPGSSAMTAIAKRFRPNERSPSPLPADGDAHPFSRSPASSRDDRGRRSRSRIGARELVNALQSNERRQ